MDDMTRRELISQLNPRFFELIIFPTEQCNFRCDYCYEDFSIGRMPKNVVAGIKRLIESNSPNMSLLSLSWFGGEPLLAPGIVLDVSRYATELSARHGYKFVGSMTTNGYLLTADMTTKLIEVGVTKFQVSLDGIGTAHDLTRKLANGGGTFERIWENLNSLRELEAEFNVTLRLHLTPNNIKSMYELAVLLSDWITKDSRFSIFVKSIENLGGPNSKEIQSVDREEARLHQAKILELVNPKGKPASSSSPYVCYASKPNSFSIRADGRVQKCTVALDAEHNTIGRLDESGVIAVDQQKIKQWMRGFSYGDLAELACPAHNFPRGRSKGDIEVVQI